MSMSNISIVGNLARAPEQICFATGTVKTVLVVAVNNSSKSAEKQRETAADFYRVEMWGKLAELAQKYLNKGNQVGISGRLIMEHWTDREGRERLTPVVSATQLSFPQRMTKANHNASMVSTSSDGNEDYDDGSELFEGARAVTVAEPPPHYYKTRPRLHAVANDTPKAIAI